MIKIIHQKDPANIQKPVCYEAEEGVNVLAWLIDNFESMDELCGNLACSFVLNDKEIFRSDHAELDESILDITISNFDKLVIVNRPAGLGAGAIIAIVSIVISVAAAAYAFYNMPSLPGNTDNDSAKTSPNNLLNAASNTMRPGEGIPECFGKGVSYPDRIQPPYYYYEDNIKKVVSLLCVGVGKYNLPEVRVGSTDINDIVSSSYQQIEPYESVDQSYLQIHRATSNVDGQVLVAPDSGTLTYDIIGNPSSIFGTYISISQSNFVNGKLQMYIPTPALESLGLSAYDLNNQTWDETGNHYLYFRTTSTVNGTVNEALNGVFYVSSFDVVDYGLGLVIPMITIDNNDNISWLNDVDEVTIAGHDFWLMEGVVGLGDGNGVIGQGFDGVIDNSIGWFELTGDNNSECLVHWTAPSGITSDQRKAITVNVRLQARHEESGTIYTIDESLRLNTLDAQYRTTFFNADTVSGFLTGTYSVRMKRLTNELPSGYIDTIKAEAFIGVEYYTKENFGNTTALLVERTATLTGQDQSGSKINCDYERYLPYYNRTTDEYEKDNSVITDSFADATAYTLIMKGNETEETVDLAELYGIYDNLSDPLLGEFTFTFDDANLSKGERIESTCNVARTTGYHDGRKWRFARDEIKPVRSALFNRRSVVSNNAKQAWQPQRSDDASSVRVYYVDPDDNTEMTIERAFDTTTGEILTGQVSDNVLEIKLAGCRNVYQATNRADLEVRRLAYQRRTVTETTYRDALEIDLLDRVGWVDINDLETFDGEILYFTGNNYDTTERFEAIDGESYFVFITDSEGYPSNTVECLPRNDTDFGFYAEGLSGAYIADSTNQIGSRYFITNANDLNASNFIINARTPNSDGTVSVDLVEYNSAMYEKDAALPPSAAPVIPRSLFASSVKQDSESRTSASKFVINRDGTMTITTATGDFTTNWYSDGAQTNIGNFFEIFVERGDDVEGAVYAGVFYGFWVKINGERDFTFSRLADTGVGVSNGELTIKIREIEDHSNTATAVIKMNPAIANVVSLPTNTTVEDITSTNAGSASLSIASNGKWKTATSVGNVASGGYTTIVNGIGALYECRATNLVGELDLGEVDTWITLSGSGAQFAMNASATEEVTFDLEIREIANTSNSDTTAVTLSVDIS